MENNRFKNKYLALLIPIIILGGLYWSYSKTIIITKSKEADWSNQIYQVGDTISVFENFNFNEGYWEAYIVISDEDLDELPKSMIKSKYLHSKNISLFSKIKTWKFIYQGGDMATVNSKFILVKNNKIIFETGIVLTEQTIGFQSNKFGWITSLNNSMVNEFSNFEPEYKFLFIF